MIEVIRSPVRASTFLSKEIYEILRQPRLALTLILGPFLILLLFGVGYRNEPRTLRAVYVVSEGNPLREQVDEFATTLGESLVYVGMVGDEVEGIRRLQRNEVDLVVVVPDGAVETIRNNTQAQFTILHNEIDPIQTSYVDFVGQFYVEEINRRVLQQITGQGQADAAVWQEDLSAARTSAGAMQHALENGDVAGAQAHQQEVETNVSALAVAVGATAGLLGGVEDTLGGGAEEPNQADVLLTDLAAVRAANAELGAISTEDDDLSAEAQQAAEVETTLADLEGKLAEFLSLDPVVLVSPLRSEARTIAPIAPRPLDFLAPAVLALLLQHLAVTLGALSVVRDRTLGAIELFRVSPISAAEALVGKYLSFMLFGSLVAGVLALLLRFALGVPMLGNWLQFALVLGLLLFTSLGCGFVISLMSQTDSQAVQYSMIFLLASVFFGGFFIALHMFWESVRAVSWLFPVNYGTQMLQSIMLRGTAPHPVLLGGLALLGVGLFVIAWVQMSRLMARR